MKKTQRITDPDDIDNDELRWLAYLATQVAHLYATLDDLDDLYMQEIEKREESEDDSISEETPASIAYGSVLTVYEELDRYLEGAVAAWLAKDPEHWHIYRLILLEPWREASGTWCKSLPLWVMMLITNTMFANFQQDPYERPRPEGGWFYWREDRE